MFKVKPMRASDFTFATKLANTMGWNMATEDFQFDSNLEPEGCLVAFRGRERVGISTCVSFGKVGWFGNLIVKEECRSQGAGTLLVKQSVRYLQSKGVQTVGIYAYPNLIPFYSRLGFRLDKDFAVFHSESSIPLTSEGLQPAEPSEIEAIEALDTHCFGGDRKRLLESIILDKGNLCYCVREDGEVAGYAAATVYEKMASVGPLICREGKVDVAVRLLKAVLSNLSGKSVYAVLPKNETVLADMLFSAGFREDFSLSRMFLGKVVARNCVYVAESLERG
jgi:predicted N-acetyltransferase YhbS